MKIAVLGAGLGGCITAMHYGFYGSEVDVYHDPNVPIQRVGQGTTPDVLGLIYAALGTDWHSNNNIKATQKIGIRYRDWTREDIFHPFSMNIMSAHYVPDLLKDVVLDKYNFIEKNISDPEQEIDADYIFDCRGIPDTLEDYHRLTNPINAVILATEPKEPSRNYTDSVATPDGWTFIVPNHDSTSYGYLYNNAITNKEEARKNLSKIFDVEPDGDLSFRNYIAKSIFRGKRTILNGNRLAFLEPLEATSGHFYKHVAETTYMHLVKGRATREAVDNEIMDRMRKIETFVLWHYQNGSKYDTPFWEYAKTLSFKPYAEFDRILDHVKESTRDQLISSTEQYAIWHPYSFKNWTDALRYK